MSPNTSLKGPFSQVVGSGAPLPCKVGSPWAQEKGQLSQAWADSRPAWEPWLHSPYLLDNTFPALDLSIPICNRNGYCSPLSPVRLVTSPKADSPVHLAAGEVSFHIGPLL